MRVIITGIINANNARQAENIVDDGSMSHSVVTGIYGVQDAICCCTEFPVIQDTCGSTGSDINVFDSCRRSTGGSTNSRIELVNDKGDKPFSGSYVNQGHIGVQYGP